MEGAFRAPIAGTLEFTAQAATKKLKRKSKNNEAKTETLKNRS